MTAMLPVLWGGVTVTVQRGVPNRYNDQTYTDHHCINGCIFYQKGVGSETGNPAGGPDVFTDQRTLLFPPGADLLGTDRVIVHPAGVPYPLPSNSPIRKSGLYQVDGHPVNWVHPVTGWNPGQEATLVRIT